MLCGLILISVLASSLPVAAADLKPTQPPAVVIPEKPGATATVDRFGTGAIVRQEGKPTATVDRFGNGAVIRQDGRPAVVCDRFGPNGTICR